MDGGDDVFIINNSEEAQAEETTAAPSAENVRETEAEAMEQVKGLVPLCVQHVHGPELSTAVFGYDIAQMAKRPWAEPGAKLSDYFNYGFNEKSWRVYCAMQKNGEDSLLAKAAEMLKKLEATARPAGGEEAGVGAGDAPMMMMGGGSGGMEGYNGNPYGGGGYGGEMGGRGGYGPNRPYNHHLQQQQMPPRDFHGGHGGMGGMGDARGHNANYKTRLCKSFAEGHCNRGEMCNYAHGVAELRQPGGGAPPPQQQQQQQGGPQMGGAPVQQQQQQQQQQPSQGYGGAAMYPSGSAPPAPPERTANYLMPPSQAGGGVAPLMMQPNMMMMPHDGEGSGGFRQPPKRQRHEGGGGGGVYEPQY